MFENIARGYLKGLTPEQIHAGLPDWLLELSNEQWQAVWSVANAELMRRTSSILERLASSKR